MLQLVDHVLLAGAHARGYLHGVVAREHGVLDGGQHLQRVGEGGGAALGAAEVMARKAALDAVLQQRWPASSPSNRYTMRCCAWRDSKRIWRMVSAVPSVATAFLTPASCSAMTSV